MGKDDKRNNGSQSTGNSGAVGGNSGSGGSNNGQINSTPKGKNSPDTKKAQSASGGNAEPGFASDNGPIKYNGIGTGKSKRADNADKGDKAQKNNAKNAGAGGNNGGADTAKDGAKEAGKDAAKKGAEKAGDAAKEAGKEAAKKGAEKAADSKSGAVGGASSALHAPSDLKSSIEEAKNQDLVDDVKDVAKDTFDYAKGAAKDVGRIAGTAGLDVSAWIGLIGKTIDYAAKAVPKLAKIAIVITLAVSIIFVAIFGSIATLPKMLLSYIDGKIDENQLEKAEEKIQSFYEKREKAIIDGIMTEIKYKTEIDGLETWQDVMSGWYNEYNTVTVTRTGDSGKDAVIEVVSDKYGEKFKFLVRDIYLGYEDDAYINYKLQKYALINGIMYVEAFKDNEDFKNGKAVSYQAMDDQKNTTNKWRFNHEGTELNNWLDANEEIALQWAHVPLVDENGNSLEERINEDKKNDVNGGYHTLQFEIVLNGLFTEEQIYNSLGLTPEQQEQLKYVNMGANLLVEAVNLATDNAHHSLEQNFYPRLDIYTNLFGNGDSQIWTMLPTDYKHIISATDRNSASTLIRYLQKELVNQLYYSNKGEDVLFTRYADGLETADIEDASDSALMLRYVFNTVDDAIDFNLYPLFGVYDVNDSKTLIGGIKIDTFAAFQFTYHSWHTTNEGYTPVPGDLIFLYKPQEIIADNGTVTTVDKPTVAESVESNTTYKFDGGLGDIRVSDVGFVEYASSNEITFIHYNSSSQKVERITLPITDSQIVGYSTPNYNDTIDIMAMAGALPTYGNFLLPFDGTTTVSATFPRYRSGAEHHGVDFACPVGTRVLATASGTVVFAGYGTGANATFGNYVQIEHELPGGEKVYTFCAHLSQCLVKEGQFVAIGDLIGLSGETGNVTGPHIHFAVKQNNAWEDPREWLARGSEVKLDARVTNSPPSRGITDATQAGSTINNDNSLSPSTNTQ